MHSSLEAALAGNTLHTIGRQGTSRQRKHALPSLKALRTRLTLVQSHVYPKTWILVL